MIERGMYRARERKFSKIDCSKGTEHILETKLVASKMRW